MLQRTSIRCFPLVLFDEVYPPPLTLLGKAFLSPVSGWFPSSSAYSGATFVLNDDSSIVSSGMMAGLSSDIRGNQREAGAMHMYIADKGERIPRGNALHVNLASKTHQSNFKRCLLLSRWFRGRTPLTSFLRLLESLQRHPCLSSFSTEILELWNVQCDMQLVYLTNKRQMWLCQAL